MPQRQALRTAMLLGLAGFALLSLGDSVIKTLSDEWPGTAVAALRFALGAAGLAAVLAWKEGRQGFSAPRLWLQAARGVALAVASLAFFLAIFVMPLAEATAIQFANPMLTAFVSAWLLGEKPTRVTVLASLFAFAGVLVVLRPNVAELGVAALLPLVAALGMAFLMTLNRMAARDVSPLAAQFFVAAFATPCLLVAAVVVDRGGFGAMAVTVPDWSVVARCALVAVTATLAHSLVYLATERASSAAIAPTVYVQIIAATVIGVIWFGDRPDTTAMIGTAMIIGAGLWLWRRNGRTPASVGEVRG